MKSSMEYFLLVLISVIIGCLYIVYSVVSKKRLHAMYELSLAKVLILIIVLSLFPQILFFIDSVIGIVNLVLIIFGIWIIVLFIIVFEMYRKVEFQRQEITKLVREVAFLKYDVKSSQTKVKEKKK